MTLGPKLAAVFVAFVALLVVVIVMAFRERRLGRSIGEHDRAAQQASDARVLAVIFTTIIGGMLLTVLVAWLVFF
jgi:membrane protein implicated in regulation of membrane protease activity